MYLAFCFVDQVQRWMFSTHLVNNPTDTSRVAEGINILSTTSGPSQNDLRQLLRNFSVARMEAGRDSEEKSRADIIDELRHKVVVAARKLQEQAASARERAGRSAEQPAALRSFEDARRWLRNYERQNKITRLRRCSYCYSD